MIKKYKIIWGILVLALYISCKLDSSKSKAEQVENNRGCENIPSSFSSFEEAKDIIINTEWTFNDLTNTESSTWIRSAEYFSCDNKTGYLIICLDNKCYVYDNVEKEVWLEFKDTEDYGKYYHKVIKNKYQMYYRIK